MSRSPNDAASGRPTQSEYEEAAALAARVVALPNHGDGHAWPAIQVGLPNGHDTSPVRRFFAWLFYITAWLTTLVLAVFAGLRLFDHDATHFLVWINAFTRYVYLPAYVCLAWALWRRRWILALLN